jgi:hypothetical protein
MKNKVFCEQIFDIKVFLILEKDFSKVRKYLEKRGHIFDGDLNDAEGIVSSLEGINEWYIWFKKPIVRKTIIHECTHLTRQILNYNGIDFSDDQDEVLSYYMEYWTELFFKFYKL